MTEPMGYPKLFRLGQWLISTIRGDLAEFIAVDSRPLSHLYPSN